MITFLPPENHVLVQKLGPSLHGHGTALHRARGVCLAYPLARRVSQFPPGIGYEHTRVGLSDLVACAQRSLRPPRSTSRGSKDGPADPMRLRSTFVDAKWQSLFVQDIARLSATDGQSHSARPRHGNSNGRFEKKSKSDFPKSTILHCVLTAKVPAIKTLQICARGAGAWGETNNAREGVSLRVLLHHALVW